MTLWLQTLSTVLTNVPGILPTYNAFRRRMYCEGVIGVFTVLTSVFYHMAETLRRSLLGMSAGQWHRLDNVFALLTFNGLVLNLLDVEDPKELELYRWICVCVVTWCQEAGPWDIRYTIGPLILPGLFLIVHYFRTGRFASMRRMDVFKGAGFIAVAFIFFARGLDEDNDYLRLNHGLWHVFSSIAFHFFLSAKVLPGEVRSTLNIKLP
eukprot:CAMPEP_0177669082 /NCGR_PEP_ID=MMETSP0447-20121125/23208_1 /TAXON_ID=0 /ORGANISM="Stygamoeba regulata, Strain BSH-02190019" /LENGTH=208 /DNA_ID=CAMNT_0019175839 /DNA_START=15 /DNA_END=641 /DNA_ORIENTATION=+